MFSAYLRSIHESENRNTAKNIKTRAAHTHTTCDKTVYAGGKWRKVDGERRGINGGSLSHELASEQDIFQCVGKFVGNRRVGLTCSCPDPERSPQQENGQCSAPRR